MSWYRDRIDWLGVYPYESASAEEVVEFVSKRGGVLNKSFDTSPSLGLLSSGCAEYVFEINPRGRSWLPDSSLERCVEVTF